MPYSTHTVSVIIPCYNQAHFLGAAIESVLRQSHRHFEILVINDGSQDNVSEVASGYPEVRCIEQENKGLSEARNVGIRESTGDYLVFLDADDRLLPDALKAGTNALAAHPQCAFVFGQCEFIALDGSELPFAPQPKIEREHYMMLLRDNYIWCPATVMYRRWVFDVLGKFDSSVSSSADYEMYLRITRQHLIFGHREIVAQYRHHSMNMSRNAILMLNSSLRVLRAQHKHLKEDRRHEEAYASGIRHWQEYYGEKAVLQIRRQIRERRQWTKTINDALMLSWLNPHVFFKHLSRKLYCLLWGIKTG